MGTHPMWKALAEARFYGTKKAKKVRKAKKGKSGKSAKPRSSPFVRISSGGALGLGKRN